MGLLVRWLTWRSGEVEGGKWISSKIHEESILPLKFESVRSSGEEAWTNRVPKYAAKETTRGCHKELSRWNLPGTHKQQRRKGELVAKAKRVDGQFRAATGEGKERADRKTYSPAERRVGKESKDRNKSLPVGICMCYPSKPKKKTGD